MICMICMIHPAGLSDVTLTQPCFRNKAQGISQEFLSLVPLDTLRLHRANTKYAEFGHRYVAAAVEENKQDARLVMYVYLRAVWTHSLFR